MDHSTLIESFSCGCGRYKFPLSIYLHPCDMHRDWMQEGIDEALRDESEMRSLDEAIDERECCSE